MNIVTVKLQRPLAGNDSMQSVLSYIVDEDGEQVSDLFIEEMPLEDIDLLFGEYYKVYYLGKYGEGKPIELFSQEPTRQDEWV